MERIAAFEEPSKLILNGDPGNDVSNFSTKKWNPKIVYPYIDKVAKELGENQLFYICDLADILWKIQEWKIHLPKAQIFYAVKANPDPVLLRLMVMLGYGFDCASYKEIEMVLDAGADPKKIIFAHTVKSKPALKYAQAAGVDFMTFDCKDELLKIHDVFPCARLVLRVAPTDVDCSWDLSEKFGCPMSDVRDLLQLAKEKNMNVVGMSFHVGALCTSPKSFVSIIRNCRQAFDLARQIGFHFTILDIGGGFFGRRESHSIFTKVSAAIRKAIEEFFPGDEVQLLAEPGCYIAQSAYILVTTIIGKRTLKSPESEQNNAVQRYYYLNDGIYGSFFRGIHSYQPSVKPLLTEFEIARRPVHRSTLFGQTCCSEDVIWRDRPLPEMQMGECLVWEDMGAYSQAVCTTFCGVALPVTRHIYYENERVNMDVFENRDALARFLEEHAVYVNNVRK